MKQTNIINSEIKARCRDYAGVRNYLVSHGAEYKSTDHQIGTYFNVHSGRLKLREGLIEIEKGSAIGRVLEKALGIKVQVDKKREIYFIDNVKFHIDTVKNLGTFMEIEAIDWDGSIGAKKLQEQCVYYVKEVGITKEDLATGSYSDLLVRGK